MTDFTRWLIGGKRGISSNAIVSQLTGIPADRPKSRDYPHDPDDFARCARLLAMYPEAMSAFRDKMPSRSPVWAALVARWDDIHQSMETEVPGFLEGAWGAAPKTYHLMRDVIDTASQRIDLMEEK